MAMHSNAAGWLAVAVERLNGLVGGLQWSDGSRGVDNFGCP